MNQEDNSQITYMKQRQREDMLDVISRQISTGKKNLTELQQQNQNILTMESQILSEYESHNNDHVTAKQHLEKLLEEERQMAIDLKSIRKHLIEVQSIKASLQTAFAAHEEDIDFYKENIDHYKKNHEKLSNIHSLLMKENIHRINSVRHNDSLRKDLFNHRELLPDKIRMTSEKYRSMLQ